MRPLTELIDTADPGWLLVEGWLAEAKNHYEVLPSTPVAAERTLSELQVTTRSPMGAIAYKSGGLLFDHGWLRVLGSGHPRLPRTLSDWNEMTKPVPQHRLPGALLIADDAVGGFFAINGGAFDAEMGQIHYFTPDTLDWENTRMGYSDFLRWACLGDLSQFYANSRWEGWEQDAATLSGDRAFLIYPFLWTTGPAVAQRSRADIPVTEIWESLGDMRRQLREQHPN